MSQHKQHQMQLTSLYMFWTQDQVIKKFRNKMRIKIIELLQQHPGGLSDTEMGKLIGCYPNLNKNRPRRNDLSREQKNRFNRPVVDSGKKIVNEYGIHEIVWVLNSENLNRYMRE